mmetsp:Transcript_27882/g.52092  ORF Transcript_27882/g.52092 Transcript_27882/m.52092 type:complete len:255 (-) Transcript_27882:1630-2394(-)
MFNSVVLPTPLGPTKAIRSPRCTLRENGSRITFSPKAFEISTASRTLRPDFGPASSAIAAVPLRLICAARSARKSCKARTRPWLRLRRADMPSTAHRASALILRFSLWRWLSSSAQVVSRQASKASNPFSIRRTIPLSIQRVARVSSRKNARSCEIRIKPARVAFSSSSSQPMASMSKWFVGSSSSIRSGASAISRASAARRRSPPEAVETGRAGSNFSPSPARSTLYISEGSRPCAAKSPSVEKPDKSGSCSI